MIEVVVAVVRRAGLLYVQRRPGSEPYAGQWEFPGGKVDPRDGGDHRAALRRELREELRAFNPRVGEFLAAGDVVKHDGRAFRLYFYECEVQGDVDPVAPAWGFVTDAAASALCPVDVAGMRGEPYEHRPPGSEHLPDVERIVPVLRP